MNIITEFFLAGFSVFFLLSMLSYREEAKRCLPGVLPGKEKKARKYILIENLLFVLMPETTMLGIAALSFFDVDIYNISLFTGILALVTYAIISIFSIGFSRIYSEKVQDLISKEKQKVSAA